MAKRNDRIGKLNAATVALMEAVHDRRRQADAIRRAEDAKLHALQAASDRRSRELQALLDAHPLAVDDLERSDEARIGVMIDSHDMDEHGGTSVWERMVATIDNALKPDEWFSFHGAERSWWIMPKTGNVIVATAKAIATDAADAAAGRRLSELAKCLGLTRYKAFAKWDADEARSGLGDSAREAGNVVDLMGPRWDP